MHRRHFLLASAGGLLASATSWPALAAGADGPLRLSLRPAPAEAALFGEAYPPTRVWAYDGRLPGPVIRARQGQRLTVEVTNGLPVATTVHWHGVRLPNAMDGVPHLTQPPIEPGDSFLYDFELPDAGTFWYHPHLGSAEQLDRGLSGLLIVEEAEPPAVDRELVWLLDDWRLDEEAQIVDDFGNWHDVSHGGRIGNSVTINGRAPGPVKVTAGERLRLRLVNAANARIFSLDFGEHAPWIIALDGQPVEPHRPRDGRVILAPSQRADLILDMTGAPGAEIPVTDDAYSNDVYDLTAFVYGEAEGRPARAEAPAPLAANPLPEPDLERAERHEVRFGGGMMDPAVRRGDLDVETVRDQFGQGRVWRVNGEAYLDHVPEPLFTLARGVTARLELVNDTAWAHPIHLHGHAFRLLEVNGEASPRRPWMDSLLMLPGDSAAIAFVADNPGDWMFHCHIPEHQEAGMMSTLRVA